MTSAGRSRSYTANAGEATLTRCIVRDGDVLGYAYALGREVGHPDAPIMREIIRQTAPDYQLNTIIKSVVKSTPFLMRRAPGHDNH